ncbi:MAG: thiamine pyrophosphate-dependent enzyme [Kiritimatiellia bacterium]
MSSADVTVLRLSPGDLLAEGFHARLNADALAHAPVIYLVCNNGKANGEPLPMKFANPCLIDLAPAYRIRGMRIETVTADAALETARCICAKGQGPFFIEWLIRE